MSLAYLGFSPRNPNKLVKKRHSPLLFCGLDCPILPLSFAVPRLLQNSVSYWQETLQYRIASHEWHSFFLRKWQCLLLFKVTYDISDQPIDSHMNRFATSSEKRCTDMSKNAKARLREPAPVARGSQHGSRNRAVTFFNMSVLKVWIAVHPFAWSAWELLIRTCQNSMHILYCSVSWMLRELSVLQFAISHRLTDMQ